MKECIRLRCISSGTLWIARRALQDITGGTPFPHAQRAVIQGYDEEETVGGFYRGNLPHIAGTPRARHVDWHRLPCAPGDGLCGAPCAA